MLHTLHTLIYEDDGATMVEYGLLVALIALVALGAVQALGVNLASLFTQVGADI